MRIDIAIYLPTYLRNWETVENSLGIYTPWLYNNHIAGTKQGCRRLESEIFVMVNNNRAAIYLLFIHNYIHIFRFAIIYIFTEIIFPFLSVLYYKSKTLCGEKRISI